MKRLLQRLIIAAALLFAIGSPLRAQKLGVEDITPVYDLVKTFKRIIPYHDTASHLTVTHVFMNTDYRYVKLFLRYDPDQSITPQTQKQILDYLVHHDLWSLQPLADHTFDLRVELSIKDKPVSARYDYTTADLQNAISPPLEQLARDYIAQVVQTLQGDLPAHLDDDGQMLVASHYDTAARRVTNTYVFPDTVWPSVRDRIVNHTDEVRRITAQNLLSGAAEGMATSAYLADVTLCYRYGNYSRTDSAEVFIAPWMWETYYNDMDFGLDTVDIIETADSSILLLSMIAASVNKDCPAAVDSLTTMLSCTFDSVNRVLTYTYRVNELAMLNIENNANAQSQLTDAVEQALLSDAGRPLAQLLVSAQATLVYSYTSPRSQSPLTLTFPPARIEEILNQ
jgi:hypothetical protein